MTIDEAISLLRVAMSMCLVDKRHCDDVEVTKILDEMREAHQIAIDALEQCFMTSTWKVSI